MKFWRLLSLTLLTISVLGLMGTSYAANTDGAVTFTVTTANYTANYSPNNIAAVWVVDSSNRFVKTLCRHARTRINYLLQWVASRGSYTNVDGVTSSTLTSQPQTHTVSWNCRDTNNMVVPDGTYSFRVEYTSANGQGPYTTNWCKFVKGPTAVTTNYPNLTSSGGQFTGMSLTYTPAAGDIALTGLSPTTGIINSNVTVQVTVSNQTANVVSFSVTLSNVTTTATLIGSQQINNVAGGASSTVTFNWNTAGLAAGSYQLKATAGPLTGEVNTADNVMTGTVTLSAPLQIHDIAISSVTVAPTIPQNVVTHVIVALTNAGDFSETFDLSCNDLTAAQTIGSQTVSNLASQATTNVVFSWNTTNAALGVHVLRTIVAPVAGETRTVNNSNIVTVTVTVPDEINTLIARGSSWKYLDAGLDISGAPWTQLAIHYDDGFWASGLAPLGYGLPNIATLVNDGGNATNRYTTTYFRREFLVDFAPVNINICVRRADGVVLYLNGVEIARQNMPDGSVAYGTAAATEVSAADATNYFSFTVAPSNLIVGRNLLAAELHKSEPANAGLGFDLELSTVNPAVTRNYRVSPIAVQPDGVIQAGDVLGVSVTLTNQGNASTSFTVVLKDAASGVVLASQQVDRLTPGETIVVHLTWPTISATTGSHTLQAVAAYNGTTNVVDVPTVSVTIPPPSFTARKVNAAASIGGRCNALAVSGNYVYLGCGASLEIWDASQPSRPVKVGSLRLAGIIESLTAGSGWVYAAAGASGVHMVDARSPAAPVHAATYDSSGHARRINLFGNQLYLADVLGGVRILDVSNPAAPTLVGAYPTIGPAQAVAFSGPNLLVLDGHEGLQILQSVTPVPVLSGALRSISGGLSLAAGSGMALAGDADGKLFRINIATSATPTVVTNVLLPAPGYSLALAGSALYVAAGPVGLLTLRSDTLATTATNAMSGGEAVDAAVNASNTTLYVAAGFAGCQAWNISGTPLAPQPLAVFGNGSRPVDAATAGATLFVAGDEGGLQVHSLTHLSSPTWRANVAGVHYPRSVAVSGEQAFVADANGGLTILNISNAIAPTIIGSYAAPGLGMIRRLAVAGTRTILTDGKQIQLLSIANPAAPALIATNMPSGFVFDLAASTSYLFAACGGAGLRAFELAGLNEVGTYHTPGPAVGVTINNAYVHVAIGPNGWQTLDISNPATPALVQTFAGTTFGVSAAGPLVYTIDGQGEAQTVNVSTPLTPITAQTFSSLTRTLRVSAAGRLILASEDEAGLALLSAGTTNVNLSPTNLNPSCAVGQNATGQSFDVWSSGDGIMSYAIVADTNWLSMSPTSGTSTGEHNRITVSYNTAALSAGTYSATITVVDSITLGASATIPVTLTVSGAPTVPTLSVSVTSLAASCPVGQSEVSQSFEVWNSGGGTLAYRISDNTDWLETSPSDGTSTGKHDTIIVTFHAGDAGVGAHIATITVTSPNGAGSPKTIPVTLTVGAATNEVIVDNADATGVQHVGTWSQYTNSSAFRGSYLSDGNSGKGSKSVIFTPTLAVGGQYDVYLWWNSGSSRATNVPVDIRSSARTRTALVNQRVNGSRWNLLGRFTFASGTNGWVKIRTDRTSGNVLADAVRFLSINSGSGESARDSSEAVSLDMVASTASSALDDNASQFAVRWYSVTGRTYTLYRTTDLLAGWTAVQTHVDATPPMNSYTDTTSSVRGYYMVVEQ